MGNQKFRKLFVRATAALLALLLVAPSSPCWSFADQGHPL